MDNVEEINNESDHDQESPKGYYTRAKRRRLSEKYLQAEEDATSTSGLYSGTGVPGITKRKSPIMFIPTEILQNIFKHLTYHELSSKVRQVNRRFKTVAEDLLNRGYERIQKKLAALISSTEVALRCIDDDMETKCIARLLSLLEVLNLQFTVVISTIWRYVYNKFYRCRLTCMYGGLIIDTHDSFFWKFVHCPNQLYSASVVREYTYPMEVTKIIQMTKTFCIHFDKTNEEPLTNSCFLSGCKIVDILDSAKYCERVAQIERKTPDVFFGRYSYFFKNSWFIAMPINQNKPMDWPQQQRMMHMRLRRIVLAHNDMYLLQDQYQREGVLRPNALNQIRKPSNNVYTGYGDVEDKFFYYGAMNDGAYLSKFQNGDDNEEQDDEDEFNEVPAQNNLDAALDRINSEEDILYRLPYLGFQVDVTVQCPTPLAPYAYLHSLPSNEVEAITSTRNSLKGESHLQMDIKCYGAHHVRLPTGYTYDVKWKSQ